MKATQLLAHFDRLVEAPDAIPRLRRFILDLAVRGKLVEQDAADEPASELLSRIQAEKHSLVESGKLNFVNPIEEAQGSLIPSEFPSGWALVPFGVIVNSHVGGGTPSKSTPSYWEGNIPWASVKDVGKGKYLDDTIDRISEAGLANSASNLVEPRSLIVVTRMGLGKVSINRVQVAINQDLRALRLSSLISIDYCYNFFKTHGFQGSGLTVKGIKVEELLAIPFPLPPLAEQQRIVAKVDELMTLCNELEVAQQERDRRRDRLVVASLQRLNQPADTDSPEIRREHVRFCLQQLPRLTTSPDHIKALREAILNQAIRGYLVPQDANAEPAAVLLKRILSDIERYGIDNRVQPASVEPVKEDATPFELPPTWLWTRLASVCRVITDGDHLPPPKSDDGVAFLTIGNISAGQLDFSNCRYVPRNYFDKITAYRRPTMGDLLYTVVGATYGRPVMVDTTREFCVQRHIAIVKPAQELSRRYLNLLLMSPHVYDQATRCLTGTAQPTVPLRPLRNFLIPLPPVEEQHRIVAKFDDLVALCNQLETQLTITQTDSRQLLENLLDKALGIARASAEETSNRPRRSAVSDHQQGKASLYMTSNPAMTVDQLVECVNDLGGTTTPERLLNHSGLSEDLEAFYDLLREARDSGAVVAPLGSDEVIQRPSNAN